MCLVLQSRVVGDAKLRGKEVGSSSDSAPSASVVTWVMVFQLSEPQR